MTLIETEDFYKLIESAKKNPNTISLILFGSYARGDFKKNSDIDIAIFRKKGSLPSDFPELNFKDDKFDILFIDSLPSYIKFNVFSQGKILVQKDEKLYSIFKRRFLHKFRDEYPFFEKNMNKMVASI